MATRFVVDDIGLPDRIGHDGAQQRTPYPGGRAFKVGPGEWCPFLTCLQTEPHEHDACWLCEALRAGNAFCGACRARWEPTPGVLSLRLGHRQN